MTATSLEHAIPAGARIVLDTSAVLAYLDGSEAVSPVATTVIDHFVRSGRNPALISTMTVTESLVRAFASGSDEAVLTIETFLAQFPNLSVVTTDFRVAREAARVRAATGLRTRDAIVLATALVSGAEVVVVNDTRWSVALKVLGGPAVACHLADHLPTTSKVIRA